MAYIAYGMIWISTSIVVSIAMTVTGSAFPLVGMFIPTLISLETKNNE